MFILRRLEITGFKSFADHTEIVFTGDGITAVVGPNGCGKSNVADAIAWVLGEQRAKQLRGAEMKDVIFQGSRNRQPSGMAEVVLHMVRDETVEHEPDIDDIDSTLEEIDEHAVTLDGESQVLTQEATPANDLNVEAALGATESAPNGESSAAGEALSTEASTVNSAEATTSSTLTKLHGKRHWRPSRLALEFVPGETVTVTRRLYRSGESEYLLNNRACRLRDIQDLFSGTGLSGAHYAIIEQGRIGQILSAKPMDRRTLIEEAAGITKFRVRQRAAEARLESARTNLARVSDIISEIDKQVNSLRRQAAKARRYRILREELRASLRRLFVADERALTSLLEATRHRLEEVAQEERAILEELTTREEGARRATQSARALEEELTEMRAAAAASALQRDRQERERVYREEQIAALEMRRTDVLSEMDALRARLASVEVECEQLRAQDALERATSEEQSLSLQAVEAAYGLRAAQVAEAEALIEKERTALLTHTAMAERLREISRQLETALERLGMQAEGLAREGERATSVHAERTAEAADLHAEISQARNNLAKLMAEREAAIASLAQERAAAANADAEHDRVRNEMERARHRLDTLTELDARRAHYSPAVQRLFASGETNNTTESFRSIGMLADTLNVESQWERAIEGIFGASLQSVIVPTPDDAARAAAWLKANDAGRASFLVAGLHGASDEADASAYVTSASDFAATEGNFDELRVKNLLNASPEILALLDRTFPQQMNARIAQSLDQAMMISLETEAMCVTIEGDWVAHGRFVSAGHARGLEEGTGLLTFRRELRELESHSEELGQEIITAEQAAQEARARLGELEDAVVFLNEVVKREEREVMTRELNAQNLAQEIERAMRHMRVVADDAARLAEEQRQLEARRLTALAEAEAAETARSAAAQKVSEATAALANVRRAAEIESESLGAQRATAAAAAEIRRAVSAELRRIESERDDLNERLVRHERELSDAQARIEELRHSIDEIQNGAESIEEARLLEETRINEVAIRLAEARNVADALSSELSELNHRAAEARERRAALEVERAEATARLSFVRESCTTELNQSLEELASEQVVDEDFDLEMARAHLDDLRARVENFGAVNMMALEELSEAEERLLFLTGQRQDITDGIASTTEALREIKRRSRERFRDAFDQINRNFGELFQELFGGGRGEMTLIDVEDVLESGIDIVAQPPGKRLQNVLLLSGGEKAMAALALVLAIFRYRPSPFCLLDEVDAPLDEANVGRFTSKIGEMAATTQFIIITHNKRTMEMARALYGVTMEEAGISKLVSVKFE
jgi:chromosome segregation protein